MFRRLGRCFPLLFTLTFVAQAQMRRAPDRHATLRLDDIARSSTLRFPSSPVHRPIRVPVFRPAASATAAHRPVLASPAGAAVHSGFPAIYDNYVSTPPDTQGAVGRLDVVSMANSGLLVQSRGGVPRPGYPISLEAFWAGLGAFTKIFDPRLLYDPAGDRWIASSGANPQAADAALLLAVSRTGDPGGAWDFFQIRVGPSGCWADYPVLGFSRDWIVLTANLLRLPPQGAYAQTALYVFDKAAIYQGGQASYATFGDTQGELAPVVDLDNTSAAFYFAQAFAGPAAASIRIGALRGPVGAETFTPGATAIALPETWSATSPEGEDFAPQSGSWLELDTGDSRLQNCVMRGGTMWCTHTVFLPAGAPTRSSIQWFAADPASGALLQRGLIDDAAGRIFYAFPSIAVNLRNDVVIGYTHFSANGYPGAAFAFRAGGTVGQPGSGPFQQAVLKPGEAPYVGRGADEGSNRWGDFSATVVDPADGLGFWTIQEYAAIPTDYYPGRWATWWASISVVAPGLP